VRTEVLILSYIVVESPGAIIIWKRAGINIKIFIKDSVSSPNSAFVLGTGVLNFSVAWISSIGRILKVGSRVANGLLMETRL
jgi:hypothetical protein